MLRTSFTPIPMLASARLVLREMAEGDAPEIFALRSDPLVMRYIPKPVSTRREEALDMVSEHRRAAAAGDSVMWGITVKGSDTLVGYIGFWRILKEHHRAELGYALHPDLWGQGLATEAVASAMDFGFRQMGLHSVEAAVAQENTASIHVLLRNGFAQEAHFRENFLSHGSFVDTLVFAKLTPWPPSAE